MKFLLDTNFLMIPAQFRVDVYEQLRGFGPSDFFVSELSVKELEKIAKGRGKAGSQARVALLLLKKEGVKVIPSGKTKHADESIRRIAKREGMIVCTMDKTLKARLRGAGIRVIVLRQRRHLGFEA
ncbi:MAG: DNA-binding protein [Candidatus Aenigmarchaeota archaeon]|nr:DNA-binding protein [Candidatus Aenigmarchaeota archaeon]